MAIFEHYLVTLLVFGLAILLVARIMRQRNRPAVSIAWFLAIFLIPYVGVPAYLLFGGRKLSRWAGRKKTLYLREMGETAVGGATSHPAEVILSSVGMPPARTGNSVDLLHDGGRAFRELLALLEGAERSIHITTFILGRDAVGGRVLDILRKKAREGVEVRLLLDALGCRKTKGLFTEGLRRDGGKVGVFMPVLPLRRRWSANLRNHRKIALIDDRVGLIGGMNLAREYMGPRHGKFPWLDSLAIVRGPVVEDLRRVFDSDWFFATGERFLPSGEGKRSKAGGCGVHGPKRDHGLKPTERRVETGGKSSAEAIREDQRERPGEMERGRDTDRGGEGVAQVAASGPDVVGDPVYDALLASVYHATRRVWIVTPYFIPDEGFQKALLLQARLGRDVRIILPRASNHALADLARGRFLRQIVEAGGRIFLYDRNMNHAKHFVFDDRLATVGSINLDMRSLYLNYEITMLMYSAAEVERTSAWASHIMQNSAELTDTSVGWFREWAEDVGILISPLL